MNIIILAVNQAAVVITGTLLVTIAAVMPGNSSAKGENTPAFTGSTDDSHLVGNAGPSRSLSDIEREIRALLGQGERLDRSNPASCGSKMRELQSKVGQIRAEIQRHPIGAERVWLGTAATHLNLCVSCSPSLGPENCKLTREALSELGR